METVICDNQTELTRALSEYLETLITKSVGDKTIFNIGLSGGSMVEILSEVLLHLCLENVHFFFCDERHVDSSSDELTFNLYNKMLFTKVGVKIENIHKINLNEKLEIAASQYELDIKKHFNIFSSNDGEEIPKFDALFLGLGPDGHTASLFPNHNVLKNNTDLITYLSDSPKPPSKRVTMTLRLINNAMNICFVAVGQSKAAIVKECMNAYKVGGLEKLPASLISPCQGRLLWYLDSEAANMN